MKKILTSLLLFSCLFVSAQFDTETYYYKYEDGTKDSLEVSRKLIPMFNNFISWAEVHDYDLTPRLSDIKGLYYGKVKDEGNVGETIVRSVGQDYTVINDKIWLTELLNVVVFHEMVHLFGKIGNEGHCLDQSCSSIMYPAVNGYLTYSLCNWELQVKKMFDQLKATDNENEKRDYITECKIFPRRED